MASEADGERCGHVVVSVNRHRVTLPVGGVTGRELKLEAVAQGAELQLGFRLWLEQHDRCRSVYDDDIVDVRDDQQYLAVTPDDHGPPLPGQAIRQVKPPAEGWSLVVPPWLWSDLSRHLLSDGGEHVAVLLAEPTRHPRCRTLSGRTLIPAADDIDYVEGSLGYRSVSPEFVRDAAIRARDEQLAYLAVHNHRGPDAAAFTHVDLASHERGYPALCRITGQPVGALILTTTAATGVLWLPEGARETLTELRLAGIDDRVPSQIPQ